MLLSMVIMTSIKILEIDDNVLEHPANWFWEIQSIIRGTSIKYNFSTNEQKQFLINRYGVLLK